MPNSEYVIPVFVQVQERRDRIDVLFPDDIKASDKFVRQKADIRSFVSELFSPPSLTPIEIPVERDPIDLSENQ